MKKNQVLATACSLIAAGGFFFPGSAKADDFAMTLEGESLSGKVESIDADGQVKIGPATAELEDLRYIVPGGKATEAAPLSEESPLRVILVCGSDLRAKGLIFAEEDFVFDSAAAGGQLTIGVDSVRAVRLALPIEGSRFEESLALEGDQRKEDTVFVTGVAGELLDLNCLIESISAESVSFDSNGKKQTIPRDQVHGVILASPDLDEPMPCRAIMADRSSFAGEVVSLSGGRLNLEMIDGLKIELPWANVRRLRVFSPRLVSLSILEPSSVETQPILAPKWKLRRNLSVAGNEMTLGDTVFDQGLGMAAGMTVTYKLDDDFKLFTANIGIDAETEKRGDCEFVVRGDGRELLRQRMKGGEGGKLIKIEVNGVRELELAVEAGENLDISDHANWAEASLLQAK